MPAPHHAAYIADSRPVLGHVNLMVDTFIANAAPEDLRAIVRSMLASGTPGLAATFTATARQRLGQTYAKSTSSSRSAYYFTPCPQHRNPSPTPQLDTALIRARSLYGVGLGFSSLTMLTVIVRASSGLRWEETSDMADILSIIDSDITQAIQSAKEEIESGRVTDFMAIRAIVEDLRTAINDSMLEVQSWGGEFPFEKSSFSIRYWKL